MSEKFFKTIIFVSRFLTTTFLFFYLAQTAFAQVEITEIMYDFEEGSDSGREWVEIHNTNGDLIDISDWRFFEAETNHKLKIIFGGGILSSGEYAIIVSDDVKFYIDNPTFSHDVLDSSFSLSNTGEVLTIRDSDLNDVNLVTYSSEWGANGDGNSLQKVNGSWCAGTPTPGMENISVCADSPDDDPNPALRDGQGDDEEYPPDDRSTQEQELPATYSGTIPSWTEEPKISTYAGARKRIVLAGADINFEGKSNGVDGKLLPYARHVWNFGDGSQGIGKEIIHTYYYPGEYVVVLNTTSGEYAAMDRILVEVIPADILISNVSFDNPSFIEIYNKTSYELDLSRWQLKVGEWKFTIPRDTFIRPKKKIIFPSQVTKFSFKKGSEITLLYPSGDIVTSYYKEEENIPTQANKILNNTQTAQPTNDYVEEKVVIKNTTKNEASNNSSSQNIVKSKENSARSYADINESKETKPSSAKSYSEAKPAFTSPKPLAEEGVARSSDVAKEKLINSNVSNTAQVANVLGGVEPRKENKKDGLFWGIIGVSLISLIAIYGVLISKEKKNSVSAGNEACLYKIIEIED